MKKDELLYKLSFAFVFVSIAGFLSFIITALVMREKQNEFLIWFMMAGIFLALSILSIYLLIRFTTSKRYKQAAKNIRQKNYGKAKTSNQISSYLLNCDNGSIKEFLSKLDGFESENLAHGSIYYRINKSIYNKKKNSFDIFYLFNSAVNSYETSKEKNNIENYAAEIIGFLENKYQENGFVNCVFIFQENNLTDEQKDFYCNFSGLWNSKIESDRFTINQYFTYCGIDQANNQVYFYQTLKSDEGDEVDLQYLIIKEFGLNETQ